MNDDDGDDVDVDDDDGDDSTLHHWLTIDRGICL